MIDSKRLLVGRGFRALVILKKASLGDIRGLSERLLTLLEDKESQIYQDNVAKFGITEEYVRKAFGKETLENAFAKGKTAFYLALERNKIIGFAQVEQQNPKTPEIDRIIVFPEHSRKGIGTQLLHYLIIDQEHQAVSNITVKAGKEESAARRFYEKNGFKPIGEEMIDAPWGRRLTLITYKLSLEHE